MKKYASLLAVLVLLLGLAALSYAAPAEIPSDTTAVIAKGKTQITLGGELRFRGLYGSNLRVVDEDSYPVRDLVITMDNLNTLVSRISTDNLTSAQRTSLLNYLTGTFTETDINNLRNAGLLTARTHYKNTSYYDYRVRLNLEAKVSPNTTGYIELESGTNTTDNVDWGSANGGARGVYDLGNTKESNVTIRQAWIQYQGTGLLGVPAGIKVGRQLIKLGYGLFYDHTYFGDDAILVFVQPMKELTLAAYHIKWVEGNRGLSDDSTGYGILAAYAGKGFGLSADITYLNHQNILNAGGAITLGAPINVTVSTYPDIHLWNIGLRGNVDDIAGTGLNFKADVEFQTGKINDANLVGLVFLGDSTINKIDLRGWAAMASLDYKFKTIPLSLTLEYAIGSGDKDSTSRKIESFIPALGQEQHYTFVYEYLAPSACEGLFYGNNRTGLCNTQYVKFGGAYDITKDLKAELYGYWLRAHRAVAINGATDASGNDLTSKKLGWEIDAKVTYQIDKGLTYFVEGGYFWPGDAYKIGTGTPGKNKDADDAWAVRHGITLKF